MEFSLRPDYWMNVLPIMGSGMPGGFVITGIITPLNNLTSKQVTNSGTAAIHGSTFS